MVGCVVVHSGSGSFFGVSARGRRSVEDTESNNVPQRRSIDREEEVDSNMSNERGHWDRWPKNFPGLI